MIELEEFKRLQEFMDAAFSFKVGDIVQPKALGDYSEVVRGYGVETHDDQPENDRFTLNFETQGVRYQIVERLLQQCHGGIQKHYKVRLVSLNGVMERDYFCVTQDELTLSRSFKRIRGMNLDKIESWVAEEKQRRKKT